MKFILTFLVLCAAVICTASPWNDLKKYSAEVGSIDNGAIRESIPGKGANMRSANWLMPGDKAQQLAISLELKSEDVKNGKILLLGFDSAGKMVLWRNLLNFKGGMDWTEHKFAIIVPSGVRNARLVVRLEPGGGVAGLRAVQSNSCDPAQKLLPGTELISNGWLGTANGQMPKQWNRKFWPANESLFDIKFGRSGVDLVYKDGGSRFGVEPELAFANLPVGTALRISGRYRVAGKGKARIMAEFFDASGKAVGDAFSAPGLSGTWQDLTMDTEVPARSVSTRIYLLNADWGTVTFLSAKCEVIEQGKKQKSYPLSVFASPVEGNKIIFGGKNIFHTIADSPNSLSFDFWGTPGVLRNPALVLDLPPGLRIAGAFSSHPSILRAENAQESKIERAGQQWTRYTFRNPAAFKLVAPKLLWGRQVVLAFEPTNNTAGDFPVYFFLADDAGRSSEKSVTVRVLPPLQKLANPKKFQILEWDELDICFPQDELFHKVITKYEEAGLISRSRHSNKLQRKQDDILEKRNWVMHLSLQDYTQKRIVGTAVDKLADKRYAVEYDGKVGNHNICPEYYTDSRLFLKELKRMLTLELNGAGARAGDWAFMDYEPWAAMDSCYCPICLKKFQKWMKAEKTFTADEIRRDHAAQWAAFRCEQTGRINKLTAKLLLEITPGLKVIDYDYPVAFNKLGYEKMFQSVCKDPRLYEDCIEAHFSSFYGRLGKRGFDLIDVNVKTLKKPIYLMPLISRNDMIQGRYTTDELTLSPRRVKQMLLSAASAGAAGLCIYPGYQIDGAFFPAINQGMYEVAVLENIYLNGSRVEKTWSINTLPNRIVPLANGVSKLPNWHDFAGLRAHKSGKAVLLSVFNFNPRETLYFNPSGEFAGKMAICDPIRRVRFRDGDQKDFDAAAMRKMVFAVEAEDVRFLSIMPAADVPEDWPVEDIKSMRLDHDKLLTQSSGRIFAPVVAGDVRASVTDDDRDGRPDILIEMPGRKMVITFGGAAVQQWRNGDKAYCVESSDPMKGGLLWDYLAEPHTKYIYSSPLYELKHLAAEGEIIRADFHHPISGKQLRLEKSIRVDLKQNKVTADYRIVNIGTVSQKVSLWSHNIPQSGSADIRLGNEIIPKLPIEQLWLHKSATSPVGLRMAATGRTDSDSAETVGAAPLQLKMAGAMLNQIYFWRAELSTLEAMSRPVSVAPGKEYVVNVTLYAK